MSLKELKKQSKARFVSGNLVMEIDGRPIVTVHLKNAIGAGVSASDTKLDDAVWASVRDLFDGLDVTLVGGKEDES